MKRVCNNHDYCRVDMPKEHEKIKYLPGEKSLKAPFIAYVDLECLLKKRNIVKIILKFFFFPIWVFFYEHSRITGLQRKGEGISLTPHYQFHSLHRHLDISRTITAESSPLHIASSRTRTGNLWFPSAVR